MFTKIWAENEVLGDSYNLFLDEEVEGVTMEESIENRIAEITYFIARLQEERAKLEDSFDFSQKGITVQSFLERFVEDPAGEGIEVSIFVDEVDLDGEDLSSSLEEELLKRHVDEWWVDSYGIIKIYTLEQKIILAKSEEDK